MKSGMKQLQDNENEILMPEACHIYLIINQSYIPKPFEHFYITSYVIMFFAIRLESIKGVFCQTEIVKKCWEKRISFRNQRQPELQIEVLPISNS